MNKYDDIINLDHHVSKTRKQMSLMERSAQFAPFAALTSYSERVMEASRLTDKRIEMDEGLQAILNDKLQVIDANIKQLPDVKITYFKKNAVKDGGEYVTKRGNVKKIDKIKGEIIYTDNINISLSDIININSDILNKIDEGY